MGDGRATRFADDADDAHLGAEHGEPYLDACRARVLDEIRAIVRAGTAGDARAYEIMLDYPLRRAKGLRPALCIAVCRALGGDLEEVLPSAAVVELFHNAVLIHDDIEDGSLQRRGRPALHRTHGVAQAVNCGDGLLALTLSPLLANTERLGLGRALRVLELCAAMVTESFEGQAQELRWIAEGAWQLTDADYELMVLRKTCGYSFVTPALVGAAVARASPEVEERLTRFFKSLGLAFQIQDDVLNLEVDRGAYGKEFAGDLWEGKRTLMLLHALRGASDDDRARALRTLSKPRPNEGPATELASLLDDMASRGVIDAAAHGAILDDLGRRGAARGAKTVDDVAHLRSLIDDSGAIAHARSVAERHARDAERAWRDLHGGLVDSAHARFLRWLKDYVIRREW
ncbi:MAG: polyprenyl synthetase family protein [Polyangiales bacterium]